MPQGLGGSDGASAAEAEMGEPELTGQAGAAPDTTSPYPPHLPVFQPLL